MTARSYITARVMCAASLARDLKLFHRERPGTLALTSESRATIILIISALVRLCPFFFSFSWWPSVHSPRFLFSPP